MRRPSPVRQQGFGLLSFVVVTSIVALSLVLGYSGILTRKVANELLSTQAKYVKDVAGQIEAMWPQYAGRLDDVNMAVNTATAADVVRLAGVNLKPFAFVEMSSVLTVPSEGLSYRNVVVYLAAETDEANPPELDQFRATGVFQSCTDMAAPCADRVFHVFSSLELERDMAREARSRLNKVASKAQSYFKARMLQDVERNIDVNYFRRPNGACEVQPMDLGCVDTYQPLATANPLGGTDLTRMAINLGYNDEELFSPWGDAIEASNLQDSETGATPFTMSFRVRNPAGGFYTIKAVQQL